MTRNAFSLMLAIACATLLNAQNFQNGDLEDTVVVHSQVPTGWQYIPYYEGACQATGSGMDSPDLTDFDSPDTTYGITGIPYSGISFVSGLCASNLPTIWHEGIKQSVGGFISGQTYTISFYQAVVKQFQVLDNSGSWAVYMNNTLLGVTAPTHSNAPYGSNSFAWELRQVSFIATTAGPFVFRFLPKDDDNNWDLSADTTGALRMGIDLINIASGGVGFADPSLSLATPQAYPNPSHGEFMLDLGEVQLAANAPVEVVDVMGRILISFPAEEQKILLIDLRNEADGVYFIRVQFADGNHALVKVLKE